MSDDGGKSSVRQSNPPRAEGFASTAAFVLAVAAFFAVAVHQHLFHVNSHYYYAWTWQWIPSQTVYPVMLSLGVPFFLAQALYARRPSAAWVGLLMVSALALMIGGACLQQNPPGFSRIPDVVQSRWSTGYFASAAMLLRKGISVRQLLADYPAMLGHFYLHPRQKPPGLVLIEMGIIRLLGPGQLGATVSGLLIGVAASCSILATYVFIAFFTGSRDSAFFGASYLALCPSLVLFFPMFEQCYAILTVTVAVLWGLALLRNQLRYSIALGVAYAVAGFITYLPGVIAIFLTGFALLRWFTDPQCRLRRILTHFIASLAAFAACYAALWAATRFNPIATLRECTRQVYVLWDILINVYHYPHHSLPGTIPTDLYDFALASGWMSFVLVGFYFKSAFRQGLTPQSRVAILSVLQFVLIALTGALQIETARIWMFMLPMLMLPVGLELASWRPGARLAVYAALLILTAEMCQSMEFITPQK
ncbi:MAG: hypothetical protein ABSH08_15475 [Tepidisphaeraceae bacterium]|jgi:hypothetical protein